MAQKHESIDLTTLEEVHRLLRTTEFASIGDLLERTDVSQLGTAVERGVAPDAPSAARPTDFDSSGLAPLPRRR